MAPSATSTQPVSSNKPKKRPIPSSIQTNGIHSSTSSPSPSMSTSRLPNTGKPLNSVTSNGASANMNAARPGSRPRRDTPIQVFGRGQRNGSTGLRSASAAGESAAPQSAEPIPYIKSDQYILKRFRNSKPSLIVHLHPTHFRFDEQEGSFSYKSPMRILIEHLKTRTIPHDLVEFMPDVPYYEGCMIVQIHDHKSVAASPGLPQSKDGPGKPTPFSVHNYNAYLTPSSHVPFPAQEHPTGKSKAEIDDGKTKSAEQKDKENMPAPSLPVNATQSKSSNLPKKRQVLTVVLRPTPLSNHVDLSIKAAESMSQPDGRKDLRQDGGPLSATILSTPTTAAPPTPQTAMAPPAKRFKKAKADLDSSNIYSFESKVSLNTCAPLILDPVSSVAEAMAILKKLEHPMHSAKPPSPKSRKRTVAEMAADEAFAAEQERYMLIMDERLSSNATNAQGGGNSADGDGQAGGASFEPRFERFKALENIKVQHEQAKRDEKQRQAEAERKLAQERERERLRVEALKKDEGKNQEQTRNAVAQSQANAAAARAQEIARREQIMAAARAQQIQQSQQGQPGMSAQMQGQHGHPQANNIMPNGMQAQPQRFHQQVSQAQASSPIVRNGTPQSHSSPTVNGMGNVPMQHTPSSMGGSPPRPGSVVHQNHPQMGAPGSHPMAAQRSQQSHAGTPRMPNSTPIIQQTPLNRQMSQTPRMSQGSPVQGQMAPTPMAMPNGQMMTAQQQHNMMQQQQQMQRLMQQRAQQQGGMLNGGQALTPQQMMQAQLIRQQQHQQHQQHQQGLGGANMAQGFTQHMAAMASARQQQGMPPNMSQNFMNGGGQVPNMQQVQQMQQFQMQQAQRAQAQAQAQLQNQRQQAAGGNPAVQQQIRARAQQIYSERVGSLHQNHPGGIPGDVELAFRGSCQQEASQQVMRILRQRQIQQQAIMQQQQQQQMMAQQNGSQMNMQNGMGM